MTITVLNQVPGKLKSIGMRALPPGSLSKTLRRRLITVCKPSTSELMKCRNSVAEQRPTPLQDAELHLKHSTWQRDHAKLKP